jgi:cytochrome c oxidase subunit 3
MDMAGSLTHEIGVNRRASFTGLFVLLAASTMVFAAFSSAFVVRRGLSDDWATMRKPPILFANTVILLASSVVLDQSRRSLRAGNRSGFNRWWTIATALGLLFLAGQGVAWYQLKEAGVYVSTNPSSSFFYVLTAAHAFHLLGGVAALLYVDVQALRLRLGPAKRTAIDVTAIFWHFLDGIWLYLMILFYVWG